MILQGALFGGHKSSRGQEAGLSAPETTQTFSDEDIRALCESGRVCEVIGHIRDPQMDYGRCQICGAEDEESMLEDANDQIDLPVEPIVTTKGWSIYPDESNDPTAFSLPSKPTEPTTDWLRYPHIRLNADKDTWWICDQYVDNRYDPNFESAIHRVIGFRSDGVVVWKKAK